MQNKVKETIIKYHMLSEGDRCILAVSGGADSMSLLHTLVKLKSFFGVSVRAVHVHHGIRGREADRDAEFVRKACERYGIPFTLIKVNVPKYAKEHKLSEEEAGRLLRYEAFETEARKWESEESLSKPVKIAVAHNAEDNAETILMQLARGSGLKGISGISPVRGRIIRPLLEIKRSEIEAYLISEGTAWIEDSTNTGNDYTRNRIRHDIIPRLTADVNSSAVENIAHAGKTARQADEYLSKIAEKILNEYAVANDGEWTVPVEVLNSQPQIIRLYMIRLLFERTSKTLKDLGAVHAEAVDGLINSETGKSVDLPYHIRAIRDYDSIRISGQDSICPKGEEEKRFILKAFAYNGETPPDGEFIKWFDYDKIYDLIDIRTRKSGDYITLKGVGRKSLGAFMTDVKIPKDKRDGINVIAVGNEVMWLVGYRIGESFKIDKETKTVLEIKYEEGEGNV